MRTGRAISPVRPNTLHGAQNITAAQRGFMHNYMARRGAWAGHTSARGGFAATGQPGTGQSPYPGQLLLALRPPAE